MVNSPPNIEWIKPGSGAFRAVMFDFDGTLSLLREDWPEIMIGMMVERLLELRTGEDPTRLRNHVEEFVMNLNGKPTIHQMKRLHDEIELRGGRPKSAEEYKLDYWDILLGRVSERRAQGNAEYQWVVPGGYELMQDFQNRGIKLYLVSGSDAVQVLDEVEFLGLKHFFGPHIYAPRGDNDGFLKKKIVAKILEENHLEPSQLLGFGDGVIETQDIADAGSYAVGVASRWQRDGLIHAEKRDRLHAAGARLIIPDYRHTDHWLRPLFGE
jgi:phosphoglycolate phosphatase-like HAD superfamily hydrolase